MRAQSKCKVTDRSLTSINNSGYIIILHVYHSVGVLNNGTV